MKTFIVLILFLFTASSSRCQPENGDEPGTSPQHYQSFGIFYDQDYTLEMLGLRKLNEDRNYTMGLGIYYSHPSLAHCFLTKPHQWLNSFFGKSYLNRSSAIPALMIANGTFTPDSLPAAYVISNDRPYASLTYLQSIRTYVDNDAYKSYTSLFSMGVIGTYISREVQTAIHQLMNEQDTKAPRTPRGWNNQVSNGGEFTLGYAFKRESLLTKKHIRDQLHTSVHGLEFKTAWQYSAGYYTAANYELDFRAGKIDPRHWTYMVNPLSQSNKMQFSDSVMQLGMMSPDYFDKPGTFELYLFGSARPTFILYNALLNGQFRKSAHILDFHEMKHLVFEFDGGIATNIPLGLRKAAELKLKISGRSPEFKLPGRAPRWHFWGGLDLVISSNR